MPDWAFERTVDEPSRGYTFSAADLRALVSAKGAAKVAPAGPGACVMTRHDQPATMAPHVAPWSIKRHAPSDGCTDVDPWHHHSETRQLALATSQRRLLRRCRASIYASASLAQTSRKLKSP